MAEITESKNFIHAFIEEDIAPGGQFAGKTVHTRFPPEPNGYLHIGHCKALIIDFGTAEKFGGMCNLRMDDTNPTKEDVEFVEAIKEDIHWLGFDWGDRFFYGSDYFEKDYEYAVELIKKGLAYVCELTPEEFKANRGDIGIPAVSPYRDRPVEESLAREMLALVRCRLEREDCLHDPGYGERLLACFRRIRRELPVGYARFHRPWVLEWYKANRQYREAVRLFEDFPDN